MELLMNPEVGGLVVATYYTKSGKGGMRIASGRIRTVTKDGEWMTFFCYLQRALFKCESIDDGRHWRAGKNTLIVRYPNDKEHKTILGLEEAYQERKAKAEAGELEEKLAVIDDEDDEDDEEGEPKPKKVKKEPKSKEPKPEKKPTREPVKKVKKGKSALSSAVVVDTNNYNALINNPSVEVIWAYKDAGKLPHECLCGCQQRVARFFAPGHDMKFKTGLKQATSPSQMPIDVTPFYQALGCVMNRPDLLAKFQ